MFSIKQPDSFALRIAEKVNQISDDVLQAFVTGTMEAFKTLWFTDQSQVRPAADTQRILDAFENPVELFQRYEQILTFIESQAPGLFAPEQVAIPLPYVIDPNTGKITVSDPPEPPVAEPDPAP